MPTPSCPSPLPRDGQRQREAEAGAAKWRSARSPVQDIVRLENGKVAEHWDVIQDEVKKEASRSGPPMFGDKFPPESCGEPGTSLRRVQTLAVRGFERVDALGQDFDLRRFVVFGGALIVVIGLQLGQRVMIAVEQGFELLDCLGLNRHQ